MCSVVQAIRKLNSRLLQDDRVFVCVLANADGLSLVVKKQELSRAGQHSCKLAGLSICSLRRFCYTVALYFVTCFSPMLTANLLSMRETSTKCKII